MYTVSEIKQELSSLGIAVTKQAITKWINSNLLLFNEKTGEGDFKRTPTFILTPEAKNKVIDHYKERFGEKED